jgi:hypothetical protein
MHLLTIEIQPGKDLRSTAYWYFNARQWNVDKKKRTSGMMLAKNTMKK